jgi:hypothetical protein
MSLPGDPADFAATCRLLFVVKLGKRTFPMDVDWLDNWIATSALPYETLDTLHARRAEAVSAFRANDMETTGQRLNDLQIMCRMLRAQSLAAKLERRDKQAREFAQRGAEVRRKYTDADKEKWRELAAQPKWAQHGKKRKAELIAQELHLGGNAVETIRRELPDAAKKKAGKPL